MLQVIRQSDCDSTQIICGSTGFADTHGRCRVISQMKSGLLGEAPTWRGDGVMQREGR